MISFQCPLNIVSFGAVSQAILREFHKRETKINLFPIGQPDLSSYDIDQGFKNYIDQSLARSLSKYKRTDPTLKLWHLNGSHESVGKYNQLLTFHETDSISETELNLIKNQERVFVTSKFTKKVFEDFGAENVCYLPLGIDTYHFYEKPETPYLGNDVTTWLIAGKMEERKQTLRTIKLWSDLYGNNRKHQLICLIFNDFIKPEDQSNALSRVLGKPFFNIVFLPKLRLAAEVNDTLNACDIFLSFSRCEGFNLPLAHAMALGKTCVVLNEHVHKDYCNEKNSILVGSTGKIPAIDNMFFHANAPFNSGNWYDCTDQAMIEGMERAAKSIEIKDGKKRSVYYYEARNIVNEFNYKRTVDVLLEHLV